MPQRSQLRHAFNTVYGHRRTGYDIDETGIAMQVQVVENGTATNLKRRLFCRYANNRDRTRTEQLFKGHWFTRRLVFLRPCL